MTARMPADIVVMDPATGSRFLFPSHLIASIGPESEPGRTAITAHDGAGGVRHLVIPLAHRAAVEALDIAYFGRVHPATPLPR